MALYNCKNSMPVVYNDTTNFLFDTYTRLINGNGSETKSAKTITISADESYENGLYIIFQFWTSDSSSAGYTSFSGVEGTANVDWIKYFGISQSNSNSLPYRAWRLVLVKPSSDAAATKVKFSANATRGSFTYYVYTDDYLPFTSAPYARGNLKKCNGIAINGIPKFSSASEVSSSSNTTSAKTMSWTADKHKLYIAVCIYMGTTAGTYSKWNAPTASSNVRYICSMGTASYKPSSENVGYRAHRITFVSAVADGTCSIYYNNTTSNGRFYYWVYEMSPDTFGY